MSETVVLEDGIKVSCVGVDEIPPEYKIFKEEHVCYVAALAGNILLNDLKGQLLNIVEGIGLPEKQETAIKRMVTNSLHEAHNHIGECLELVRE